MNIVCSLHKYTRYLSGFCCVQASIVVNNGVDAWCYRTVSYHVALVSDDVCKCRSHTYSAAVVGLVFLRGIECIVPGYAWHAENEGFFVLFVKNNFVLLVTQ